MHRYLQKNRYKKHQKKADKSTNVISVAKKGKNNAAAATETTTTNNISAATSNNVGGGVTFIIPKIEQPDDQPTTTSAAICKPSDPNNVSSISMYSTVIINNGLHNVQCACESHSILTYIVVCV